MKKRSLERLYLRDPRALYWEKLPGGHCCNPSGCSSVRERRKIKMELQAGHLILVSVLLLIGCVIPGQALSPSEPQFSHGQQT